MDNNVLEYKNSIPQNMKTHFDLLEQTIFEIYPSAEIKFSYGILLYKIGKRWVGLGVRKDGVSVYTDGPQNIQEFKAKHKEIKTGKGSIKFKTTDKIPIDDIKVVIRHTIENK